jgi:hypothetical protein
VTADSASLETRLKDLEARVLELEQTRIAPQWLRGWSEISAWCRLSPHHLRRYMRQEGAPIIRLGRHVRLETGSWAAWTMGREKYQRARRAARSVCLSSQPMQSAKKSSA